MTLPEQWIPRFAAKVNTDGPTPIERNAWYRDRDRRRRSA